MMIVAAAVWVLSNQSVVDRRFVLYSAAFEFANCVAYNIALSFLTFRFENLPVAVLVLMKNLYACHAMCRVLMSSLSRRAYGIALHTLYR